MNQIIRFIIIILTINWCIACQEPLNTKCDIIPAPQQINAARGFFEIDAKTKIIYLDSVMKPEAVKFQEYLKCIIREEIPVIDSDVTRKNVIVLENAERMDDEAYELNVGKNSIYCKASSVSGMFYALQSLVQLTDSSGHVPCMNIIDKPRFTWRGMMLDESRHFFGKEIVKQQLDIMARLKMNRYHWHLTDEAGWRIEIMQYPKLTEIGAEGNWSDPNAMRKFYTQDDIREIVKYATERHIMIIPEIDMPGHATAASRAYPELSSGGTGRWAGFTFHPAKESTYTFINNVLKEVSGLFSAPYIHLGCDEVNFGNQTWYTDPVIQRFIRDHHLGDEIGMEHYFMRRVCDMAANLGKTMIGWDEIFASGVTPDKAIIMWYRHQHPEQLAKALDEGYRVILTPHIPCYMDFVQDDSHKIGRRWGNTFVSHDVVYRFPDNMQQYFARNEQQVLGFQSCIWTKTIIDKKRLDFMTFPRLVAIAESAWTDVSRKNEADFNARLKSFLKYLDGFNIYYFNPFNKSATPEPWGPKHSDVTQTK